MTQFTTEGRCSRACWYAAPPATTLAKPLTALALTGGACQTDGWSSHHALGPACTECMHARQVQAAQQLIRVALSMQARLASAAAADMRWSAAFLGLVCMMLIGHVSSHQAVTGVARHALAEAGSVAASSRMSSTSRSLPMRPRWVRALAMLTAVPGHTWQDETAGWLWRKAGRAIARSNGPGNDWRSSSHQQLGNRLSVKHLGLSAGLKQPHRHGGPHGSQELPGSPCRPPQAAELLRS